MDTRYKILILMIYCLSAEIQGYVLDRSPDLQSEGSFDTPLLAINNRKLMAESTTTTETPKTDLELLKSETSRLLAIKNMASLTEHIKNIDSYMTSKFYTVNSMISAFKEQGGNNGTEFNVTAVHQASQLVSIVEDLGALALRLVTTPEYTLSIGNIDMLIIRKTASSFKGFIYNSKGEGYSSYISVPAEAKMEAMAGVVGFTLQGLEYMLSAGTNGSVVTPIASCTVYDALGIPIRVTTLDPVTIILGYPGNRPVKEKQEVAVCSFVQMDTSGIFRGWSEEQCALVSQSDEEITCRCTHLTAFAVLYRKEGLVEQLQILSWVGCAFTTLCCIITAMTMVGYRLLDSTRSYVRMNFLMSLGISEAMFLAGTRFTDIPGVCMIVAGFLHFTVLACFTWLFSYILLLGTEMRMTNPYRRTINAGMYTVIGWLLPLCIVTITMVARHNVYRDPYYCWISSRELLNLSLMVPAGVILILSWVILSYVVNMYHGMRGDTNIVSLLALTWSGIVSCTVISPLLTATWIIGTFSVTFRAIWLQALFTICNITLGLTIFFTMCLLNAEVRTARKLRKVAPAEATSASVLPEDFRPQGKHVDFKPASCESGNCIHQSKCFYGQKVMCSKEQNPNLGLSRQYTWQAHDKLRLGGAKWSDIIYKKSQAGQRANSRTELLKGDIDDVGESCF